MVQESIRLRHRRDLLRAVLLLRSLAHSLLNQLRRLLQMAAGIREQGEKK
jgi:hypothetical protein